MVTITNAGKIRELEGRFAIISRELEERLFNIGKSAAMNEPHLLISDFAYYVNLSHEMVSHEREYRALYAAANHNPDLYAAKRRLIQVSRITAEKINNLTPVRVSEE